jgi:FixJ family two-component response regulator
MTESKQTVFIVDDDPSFLTSMTRLLRAMHYAVASFPSAALFLAQRPAQTTGCVIADLQMPGMDGMALQQALAQSENPLPIIFLTGHGDIPTSVQAMRLGAEDFLQKTVSKEELLAAIERAMKRDIFERNHRMHQRELQQRFKQLTPRENEVLAHVLRGQLNKQIAADLGIDERSVKRHRTNLMNKLHIRSVAELVQLTVKVDIGSDTAEPSDSLV